MHKDNTKTPSYNHQSAVDKKCGVTCAVETLDRCDNSSYEMLETSEGRERYIERQWIVEAGHGNDQKNKKWTQYYLRGKTKAHLEFLLIRIASNIAKIIKYKLGCWTT